MSVTEFALLNRTITTSGSYIYDPANGREIILFWNIQGPITGSSPTIRFTLQEVDPFDRSTSIGQTIVSTAINTTGTGQITLSFSISPVISILWTVTGSSPSFGGVSAAAVSREVGNSTATKIISPANTSTTSVTASASNVTLLSSNTSRLGATIWNESTTATLYVKLGSTSSLSNYTTQILPSGYYEVPYGYTGKIDGIWTAAIGNARITELTF